MGRVFGDCCLVMVGNVEVTLAGARLMALAITRAIQQIVGRERRERVSQLAWCGGGWFDSRRRVNADMGWL